LLASEQREFDRRLAAIRELEELRTTHTLTTLEALWRLEAGN
jgi:hypothetical protein